MLLQDRIDRLKAEVERLNRQVRYRLGLSGSAWGLPSTRSNPSAVSAFSLRLTPLQTLYVTEAMDNSMPMFGS